MNDPIIVQYSENTRPRFLAILEQMAVEDRPVLFEREKDVGSFSQNARRRGIPIWKRRVAKNQWMLKVAKKGETVNPLTEYDEYKEVRTPSGVWKKTADAVKSNDLNVMANSLTEARLIRERIRQYFGKEELIVINRMDDQFEVSMASKDGKSKKRSMTKHVNPLLEELKHPLDS